MTTTGDEARAANHGWRTTGGTRQRQPLARIALFVSAVCWFLAACTAPTLPPTAPPPSLPAATATLRPTMPAQPSTAPTPSPEAAGLLLWTSEEGPAVDVLRALARDARGRIGVSITVVPKDATTLRMGLLTNTLVGERAPDLIWGDQNDLAELLADGALQAIGPSSGAGAFVAAAVVNASADGKLWGQPLMADGTMFLLYNRALVAQPPATTNELIVQSRAARQDDRFGLVAGWTEARWLLAWLNGFGGTPTSPDGMQPTLDTPQMIGALNLLRELAAAAPPEPRSYAQWSRLFGQGRAALAIDGDWALPSYRTFTTTLELGIAPLPRVPATGRPATPVLGGTYLMFHQTLAGVKLKQAQAFSDFLVTPEVQLRMARDLERLPALRAALASPSVSDDPTLAAAAAQTDTALGLPPTKPLRCALRAIERELPILLAGQSDPEQTARAMQQQAETCVNALLT